MTKGVEEYLKLDEKDIEKMVISNEYISLQGSAVLFEVQKSIKHEVLQTIVSKAMTYARKIVVFDGVSYLIVMDVFKDSYIEPFSPINDVTNLGMGVEEIVSIIDHSQTV